MGTVTLTHYSCLLQKQLREGEIVCDQLWCPHSLVINLHMQTRSSWTHFKHTIHMSDSVFRLRGKHLSPLHALGRTPWRLMQTRMCAADSTHKHTAESSVTFPSASNVENSTLIPCFPQREKERGTERPSLSSDSYRSHLVDGLMEQRRDAERQRQREKEAQVLENETSSLLICRGGLVARVTLSINCASILSPWNMSWVSTPLPLVALCTSGVRIVWQNKHDWFGKSTLSALWKACVRLLYNPGDIDFLVLKRNCIFLLKILHPRRTPMKI